VPIIGGAGVHYRGVRCPLQGVQEPIKGGNGSTAPGSGRTSGRHHAETREPGRVVKNDTIKTCVETLKRLCFQHPEVFSTFTFNVNLCRYSMDRLRSTVVGRCRLTASNPI